jgi:polysaccharide deacetylase family protein (PEP-CTERM system associated)
MPTELRRSAILTVDYEDWFHVDEPRLRRPNTWDGLRPAVEDDTARLLDLLDEYDARATFFVVGWLAARTRGTLREIVRRGHRLGLHGFYHVPPEQMSEPEFRADVERCLNAVADATGVTARGYRAPFFGVGRCPFPYLEVLQGCGLLYDCSLLTGVCPGRVRARMRPDGRSVSGQPPGFHVLPIPSVRVLGVPVAFSGGGFLRFLPAWFVRWAAARTAANGLPVVYYIHPRDTSPDGPVAATTPFKRLRFYAGRASLLPKLREILAGATFVSVEEYLGARGEAALGRGGFSEGSVEARRVPSSQSLRGPEDHRVPPSVHQPRRVQSRGTPPASHQVARGSR